MKTFDTNILSVTSYAIWMTLIDFTFAMNNITSRYMVLDEEQLMKGRFLQGSRKPRFLSFHTDDTEITVEMQLSVPFLTIPIKKTIDSTTGMMGKFHPVNLNLGAIGLAGAIVLGSSFVLPGIFRLLSVKHAHSQSVFGRAMGSEIIDRIGRELESRGAPPQECMGRIICWLVRRSAEASERGNPDNSDKIVDILASNEWIHDMLDNTIFQEAIAYGYTKQNCSVKYAECKLSPMAVDNFINVIYAKMFKA